MEDGEGGPSRATVRFLITYTESGTLAVRVSGGPKADTSLLMGSLEPWVGRNS